MTDMSSALEFGTGGKTFYHDDGSDTNKKQEAKVIMPNGEYPAHIVKAEYVRRDVKGRYKALVYTVTVQLAKECQGMMLNARTTDGKTIEIDAGKYVGFKIKSNGIFKFLHPNGDDSFEANPSGNKKYASFCEAIGVDTPTIETEIDGKKVKVNEIPDINESDMLGRPVKAVIKRGKPWTSSTDGITRRPLQVQWFNTWEDGSQIEIVEDDLPF